LSSNIFDYFEAPLESTARPGPWAARAPRRPDANCDLKLVARSPDWRQDPDARAVLDAVEALPWVGTLGSDGNGGIAVKLDDGWVASTGAALEAGGSAEAALADLAHGRRYSVQFWDANATKALHVGHLRNLATGNALSAALAQAGGQVERRSLISDTGRSMGEAMAGVRLSGRHTQSWADGAEKSDHFVGVCYADYVAGMAVTDPAGPAEDSHADPSQTRELRLHGDSADDLLRRVIGGDGEAIELWYRTRAWVIAGQRKTLARLGIAFDRVYFESDFLDAAARITAAGLDEGWLQRRDDGVVVHPTGVDGFEELPLVRPDGLPTQHMRAFVYWDVAPDLGDVVTMQVQGSEWQASANCRRRLATRIAEERGGRVHPTYDIFNAMVARQKRALHASDGALLIDELIDWLDERLAADPDWSELRDAHPAPERIAPQIAVGYFLPYAVSRSLEFEPEHLLRDHDSVGWDLVRARVQRSRRREPQDARPVDDPEYRFAVVQSELYRRHLRLAVERLDVTSLALFLKHLATWHLERDRGEHVERVVHTVLDRSARGLGLEISR
jgi:hypothetical protein